MEATKISLFPYINVYVARTQGCSFLLCRSMGQAHFDTISVYWAKKQALVFKLGGVTTYLPQELPMVKKSISIGLYLELGRL